MAQAKKKKQELTVVTLRPTPEDSAAMVNVMKSQKFDAATKALLFAVYAYPMQTEEIARLEKELSKAKSDALTSKQDLANVRRNWKQLINVLEEASD